MPKSLEVYDGSWRSVTAPSVFDGSWRSATNVYVYENGWQEVYPNVNTTPATKLKITAASTSLQTFETTTITVQLRDANNLDTAGTSSATINLSSSEGLLVGYFLNGTTRTRTISGTTDSTGKLEITFYSDKNNATTTITATSTGLTQDTVNVTVSLSTGLLPDLGSPQERNFGFEFANSNYNSNYTYTGSYSAPNSNSSLFYGTSYAQDLIQFAVAVVNSVAPDADQNNTQVTCTAGDWGGGGGGGGVSVTVTASRDGYTSRSASISGGTPLPATHGLWWSFQWVYIINGNYYNWGNPIEGPAGTTGNKNKGSVYDSQIKGNQLFCKVTVARNYAAPPNTNLWGGVTVDSDKITAN